MKTVSVNEFKARFPQLLEWIQTGEEVMISYQKKEVAVLMDIRNYQKPAKRKLGQLDKKATVRFSADFKMTGEELLGS